MVYERQQATAKRMIAAKGMSAILSQVTPDFTDPDRPWVQIPGTTTNTNIKIVLLPFDSKFGQYKTQSWEKEFGDVPTGVTQGLMFLLGVVPKVNDTIIAQGVTYNIIDIDTLAPNGETILYTLYLRK